MKMRNLALFVGMAILSSPLVAGADMLEVLTLKLKDGCTLQKYQAITDDFNAHFKDRDYQAELVMPLHGEHMDVFYWVGRSSSIEGHGKALGYYMAERSKDGSAVNKLDTRFEACGSTVAASTGVTVK